MLYYYHFKCILTLITLITLTLTLILNLTLTFSLTLSRIVHGSLTSIVTSRKLSGAPFFTDCLRFGDVYFLPI